MKYPIFITGNQSKADYLANLLDHPIEHKKLDLDEIQSLDVNEVVEHKVKQAYSILKEPVLVEDGSLEFKALGRLPGTFIKFFIDELRFETICRMIDGMDRSAVAKCTFAYYDGKEIKLFEGNLEGEIADSPVGENGFGWDKIFIPKGYSITRAEMNKEDDEKTYQILKPFEKLKGFLTET